MADYVNQKLPNRILALTKDTDAKITLRRRDPETHEPIPWGSQVYMLIDSSRTAPPVRVDSVIEDSLAAIVIESEVGNACRTGTTWRVVMSAPGSPSFERPLMVGMFERNDGK